MDAPLAIFTQRQRLKAALAVAFVFFLIKLCFYDGDSFRNTLAII